LSFRLFGDIAAVGLRRRWRARKREKKAEQSSLDEMRRAEDAQQVEPVEVKLSQMRD
jgi:hypothetical protein